VKKHTTALCFIENLDGHPHSSFVEMQIFRVMIKLKSNKICETKDNQILHPMKSVNWLANQDSSSYKPIYDFSDRYSNCSGFIPTGSIFFLLDGDAHDRRGIYHN
jgi:hypothetical protein